MGLMLMHKIVTNHMQRGRSIQLATQSPSRMATRRDTEDPENTLIEDSLRSSIPLLRIDVDLLDEINRAQIPGILKFYVSNNIIISI